MRLGGKLSPSVLDLKYLTYLDLSGNDFKGILIPSFFGSLTNLRYLDLSDSSFAGMVPPNLGNLTNLYHLNLQTYSVLSKPWVSDLHWLPNLSSLEYLNLRGLNLSRGATHWLQAVNMLPSLLELHLASCSLDYFPPTLPHVNLTSLSVVDLRDNDFNSSSILQWLFNITTLVNLQLSSSIRGGPIPQIAQGCLCNLRTLDLSNNYGIRGEIEELLNALSRCRNVSLEYLDLSSNELLGNLPDSLRYLRHLKYLFLSYNSLSGPIPPHVGNLSNLKVLDLAFNNLYGIVPESIGQLPKLGNLELFSNSFEGVISEVHFQNLTSLSQLSLSSTKNLVLNAPQDWVPPFNLFGLTISGIQVGPAFPKWLKTQRHLSDITISNAAISDTFPDWFWKLTPQIDKLDLSRNNLKGELPDSSHVGSLRFVDLSFNYFEGSVPLWSNVVVLLLRNNLFSGPIPSNIGHEMPRLTALELSGNFLNGSIPLSIYRLKSLWHLDLSNNNLSGKIHNNWGGMQRLVRIDLSKNSLAGTIPNSLYSLPSLSWLKVSKNNLSGELSLLLQDCGNVSTLDLGENRFSGTISKWMGKRRFLSVLRLRGNLLSGNIPEELCELTFVHILDLAYNNFSGPIPPCLGRMVGFQRSGFYSKPLHGQRWYYLSHMDLVVKGRQSEYAEQLSILNTIDLSGNNLIGEIPSVIANLSKLQTLNLSHNQLIGNIPENIGDLKTLEGLDLSCNRLEGHIPTSMSSLTFLSSLNLSYNNFSGPVPLANQFLTFDPSTYEGNPGLCGRPVLPNMCAASAPAVDGTTDEDEDEDGVHDKLWLYVSTVLGFIVGFWAVCGSLVIKETWRHSYFRFMDDVKEGLLLIIALNVARLRRKMEMGRHNGH